MFTILISYLSGLKSDNSAVFCVDKLPHYGLRKHLVQGGLLSKLKKIRNYYKHVFPILHFPHFTLQLIKGHW